MKPTEEQVRKFWEWCGFTHGRLFWHSPDGEDTEELSTEPEIDLSNLFKYAVPKLHKFGLLECSFNRELAMFGDNGELLKEEKVSYRWRLLLESRILSPIDGYGDTPALALFWAIYKVMEE